MGFDNNSYHKVSFAIILVVGLFLVGSASVFSAESFSVDNDAEWFDNASDSEIDVRTGGFSQVWTVSSDNEWGNGSFTDTMAKRGVGQLELAPTVFFDGFEDGDLNEWGGSTGDYSVQTSGVKEGTYALQGTGTSLGEITRNFSSPPNYASWYWKYKDTSNFAFVYFESGSDTQAVNIGLRSGDLQYYDGTSWNTVKSNLNENQFYFIELKNIDYSNYNYEIWVDGEKLESNAKFQQNVSSSDYFLYKYDSQLDSIQAGGFQSSGTWTSQIFKSSQGSQALDNLVYSASVGENENLLWAFETETDNTQYFQDPNSDNVIQSSELPTSITGENWQVKIKLQSSTTDTSPTVNNFELNTTSAGEIFTIDSVSADNNIIDRKKDTPWSNPQLGTTFTVDVRNTLSGENASDIENAYIKMFNPNGVFKTELQPYTSTIVDSETKRFKFRYNPADNSKLGQYKSEVTAKTSDSTVKENHQKITVLDLETENVKYGKKPGHILTIDGKANISSSTNTANLVKAVRDDSSEGRDNMDIVSLSGDDNFSTSYQVGVQDGEVDFELATTKLDGETTFSRPFPNFHPYVENVSVSETVVDRDRDYTGGSAVTETTISYKFTDPDNDQVLNAEPGLLSTDGDLNDYQYLDYEITGPNGTSIEQVETHVTDDNNHEDGVLTVTFNPADNKTDLGFYDTRLKIFDMYADIYVHWSDWENNVLNVNDLQTSFNFTPTNPFAGWSVNANGAFSTVDSSISISSMDEAWFDDEIHGTFDLENINWSESYTISDEANLGETVNVEAYGASSNLDGSSTSSYDVDEEQKFEVEMFWENDGNIVPDSYVSSENFEIKFWYNKDNPNETAKLPIDSSCENFVVDVKGESIFLARIYNERNGETYYRGRVPHNNGGDLEFLIPSKGENVYKYKFGLQDYTVGKFLDGYIQFSTGNGIVAEDWWDASSSAYAYLTYQRYYSVNLYSPDLDEFVSIRHFQAEDDFTPDPFIAKIIENKTDIAYKYESISSYAYRENDGDVVAQWGDTSDNTDLVNIRIYDDTRDKLLENASYANPEQIIFKYAEASENKGYWVEIETNHEQFGSFTESFSINKVISPIKGPSPIPHADLPVPLSSLAGLFTIIIVGMLFTRDQPGNAMLAIAITASFFSLLGTYLSIPLMPIGWGLTIFLWAMAIIYKFSEGTNR